MSDLLSVKLADLLREVDSTCREIAAEARRKASPQRGFPGYTHWASLEEKLANWPRKWFPAAAMCSEVIEGDGSGEGSPTRPGYRACTRPKGHRDLRTGDEHGHMWGPERYTEDRALHAAQRIATENWVLATRVAGLPVLRDEVA